MARKRRVPFNYSQSVDIWILAKWRLSWKILGAWLWEKKCIVDCMSDLPIVSHWWIYYWKYFLIWMPSANCRYAPNGDLSRFIRKGTELKKAFPEVSLETIAWDLVKFELSQVLPDHIETLQNSSQLFISLNLQTMPEAQSLKSYVVAYFLRHCIKINSLVWTEWRALRHTT